MIAAVYYHADPPNSQQQQQPPPGLPSGVLQAMAGPQGGGLPGEHVMRLLQMQQQVQQQMQQHMQQQLQQFQQYLNQTMPTSDFYLSQYKHWLHKDFFAANPALWTQLRAAVGDQYKFSAELQKIILAQNKWSMQKAASSSGAAAHPTQTTLAGHRLTQMGPRPTSLTAPSRPTLEQTVASASAELKTQAAAERQRRQATVEARFRSIIKPQTAEDKTFLPRTRLRSMVRTFCGPTTKLTSDAELALKAFAEGFISDALAVAFAMARRRRAKRLDAQDIALYMSQAWGVDIHMAKGVVKPYRRLALSESHRARMAAVRRGNILAGKAVTVQTAAAPPESARNQQEDSEGVIGEGEEQAAIVENIEDRGIITVAEEGDQDEDQDMPNIG